MPALSNTADVTCFETFAEIRILDDFREANPLNVDSYAAIVGYYNLPERVYCCVEKANGQLCHPEHGKGWVVRKIDGSLTIMGKDCANDKFGADSKIFQDINHVRNALRRQERLSKLAKHLAVREERVHDLQLQRQALDAMRLRTKAFLDELGPKVTQRLLGMARTRNCDVVVTAVKYREDINNPKAKKERSTVRHCLGMLAGLSCLSQDAYAPLYTTITSILGAYDTAANLGEKPSKGIVDALASRLDQYEPLVRDVQALAQEEMRLLANQMLLLCFLVDDRAERSRCARKAMHQADIPGGRDYAKTWLNEQEALLAVQLGMQRIEIA